VIGDILQPTHLIFIFVIALLVLGPKRLPEVGRSLGKGLRDFRGAMDGIQDSARDVFDPGDATTTTSEPAAPVAGALPAVEPVVASQPVAASIAHETSWPAPSSSSVVTETVSHEPHPDEYAD
jgi:sec-independent protein translocase protein TatA